MRFRTAYHMAEAAAGTAGESENNMLENEGVNDKIRNSDPDRFENSADIEQLEQI